MDEQQIPEGAVILDPVEARDAQGRDLGIYKRRGVEAQVKGEAAPPPSEEYVRAQSPELIVKQVTDRIEKHERDLAATTGEFDPRTGEAVPRVSGPRREAMERELATLRYTSLPFAKVQAADIARQQAALPTQTDALRAEGERRERINSRALEIAEEAEAKAAAERILRERRANRTDA